MDLASKGVFSILSALSDTTPVDDALLSFVRQLENDYKPTVNISLFIFAIRSFFCWHRAPEICGKKETIDRIRSEWSKQNNETYLEWLHSADDGYGDLKWEKWTFQAKNSILNEFLASNVCPSSVSAIIGSHSTQS